MGCDQEVAQENQYQQVAVTFAFEKLERSHDRQHCEACIASNDGPVFSEYTNTAEKHQWYQYPLGQLPELAEILQAAPPQRNYHYCAYPQRKVTKMGGDRTQETEADRKNTGAIRYFFSN
jgi:hypothetical protein